ncbi:MULTISPECIES: ATP-binding protein [Enterobacteriaceae]|jgi:hypothetical protein|uniref:ATP-binding protein n=1 Tax=Cedecea sp. TaxID=1970739 RepID=UPI0013574C6D|nr:ATP-binding protein [Scandinavium goeteborgense]
MNRNFAKIILSKLDAHIFVIGRAGAGKSTLIHDANIPDARYFDFVELTKNGGRASPCMLCENNYADFESELLNTPEKNLILDAVEFPVNLESSKLLHLIKTARKSGKRLIIVAFPENADPVLLRYYQGVLGSLSAIIRLDREGNNFTCEVETYFDPEQEND